jgi:hypothetical protein
LRALFGPALLLGRRAALGAAVAVLVFSGVLMFRTAGAGPGEEHPLGGVEVQVATQPPGTPVADMETLDRNFDIYANFDLLDDADAGSPTGVSN